METSQSEGLLLEASYFGLCAARGQEERHRRLLGEAGAAVPRTMTRAVPSWEAAIPWASIRHAHERDCDVEREYLFRPEGGRLGKLHRRTERRCNPVRLRRRRHQGGAAVR